VTKMFDLTNTYEACGRFRIWSIYKCVCTHIWN